MKNLFLIILCASLFIGCKKSIAMESTSTEPVAAANVAPVEFADAKYSEIGKKSLKALSKGDMDAWMADYADNAKYYWNAGDSLVGKSAIDKYWRDRRANVIETISFSKDIWLPLKVNEKENIPLDGYWLLAWYQVTAKYKGGGSMTQWIHTTFHFDANDKIDMVNQYLDRVPIMAAMSKK
ncbi:nuclear transport factor 2 family protein [Flavobacterium cellulosilyticum]|uniref:Nuclear transport factor 2 family protein n=1 Tax=Flavobacterium cellulosilyticum TaxID=2541731 RepID=A0A4R5CMG1_9FLAO|nr:nuclear transport factor 2 family protein [Flavobacterium cellulosilyticum]TDD98712.1 nuclear transport factor 2 family protein [Flavobacterium cellulosilyticum]